MFEPSQTLMIVDFVVFFAALVFQMFPSGLSVDAAQKRPPKKQFITLLFEALEKTFK